MVKAQLLKGTTTLLVLSVLRDGELYGYEIAQRIRERSGSLIDAGEGWLYPALHRLEADGSLEATWRDSDIGHAVAITASRSVVWACSRSMPRSGASSPEPSS